MKITLNGSEKKLDGQPNLQEIVRNFCKTHNHIIAEVNGRIVKNANLPQTPLQDGDKIELVSFVGGG